MRFFSRFCLCWKRKEKLEDDGDDSEAHPRSECINTAIGTDQEASPERLKSSQFRVLSRLKFWSRRKGDERARIVHEENENENDDDYEERYHQKVVDYKCELTNNDIVDDTAISERSPRDSFETIIL